MSQNKSKIIYNNSIDELLTRSISNIFPSKEELLKILSSNKKIKIYLGVDITGPTLHIGHATNLILLEKLRQLGHQIIILFGDFTAQIGDPTGKEESRRPLTKKDIENFIQTWEEQVNKIVDLNNKENPVKIKKNSSWLAELNFSDLIKLSSNFTVQQMIERDMFQERIKNQKPIHLHEFLYPLMQGYDSVAMDVDMEIGGNDQTFNMLTGRTLQKIYNKKDKFVITTTLLVDPKTGKKLMNKSEGKFIGLNDSPNEMFGKIMSLSDEAIIPVFIDCTVIPLEEIVLYKSKLEDGENPKNIKMKLAEEIVTLYHSKEDAEKAKKDFEETFEKGGAPEDIKEVTYSQGASLADIFIKEGMVASKTEWRRLLSEGAVKIINNPSNSSGQAKENTVNEDSAFLKETSVYKIGKRRFLKVVLE